MQLTHLLDIAIEYIPRAQVNREQAQKFSTTRQDFYNTLLHTAVSVRAAPASTAIEIAAADMLEIVLHLSWTYDKPLASDIEAGLLQRLTVVIKELSTLTGRFIPCPDVPPPPTATEPPPAPAPALSIAGRTLTTKEAANALNMKSQSLATWNSKQSWPKGIRPNKAGSRWYWSGDEILAFMAGKPTKL